VTRFSNSKTYCLYHCETGSQTINSSST